MRNAAVIISAVVCVACLGCNEFAQPPAISAPPHGGEMFALPDDRGWVELRNEQEKAIGKVRHGAIVAYFFKPDRQTALDTPPKDVKITLNGVKGQPETMPLAPSPASDETNRFASKVGPVVLGDLPGELSGKLGESPFTLKFRARR